MRPRNEEASMLSRELDILMGERQRLLEVVGAAAALIASLDSRALPPTAVKSADLVATSINALSDETLRDALAAVRAEIEDGEPDDGEREGERVVSH
ncbi:MAG: hypothetical protein AW10_00279 [Candidatus Accumulibacter appositus]|uniref:Uncharacterized protein n=1 Tax=Candidatus Accumulibacter appositus TaxID=1454003 RepID=A0A011Q0Y0_9PROT|nr:hypothetical protein [Accumulibacter sp.]EXI82830.1 MAG: hypothetical protein AW10_00279 [Candidatus Accumulibacter appositus]HRF05081.1 hypothetical protein [Accumulibacter sp.]